MELVLDRYLWNYTRSNRLEKITNKILNLTEISIMNVNSQDVTTLGNVLISYSICRR